MVMLLDAGDTFEDEERSESADDIDVVQTYVEGQGSNAKILLVVRTPEPEHTRQIFCVMKDGKWAEYIPWLTPDLRKTIIAEVGGQLPPAQLSELSPHIGMPPVVRGLLKKIGISF